MALCRRCHEAYVQCKCSTAAPAAQVAVTPRKP